MAPPSQTITAPPATPPLAPPPPSEEEAEVAVEAEEDTPDEATVSAEVSASPAAAEPAPTEQTQAQTAEHSATPATAHDESADTQTYVTASGKVIRVSRANAIPTARKKREVVRFSVVLIVLLFLGAVIGATVFAVMLLRGGERQPEVQQENVREAMGGFDPNVNPFKMPRANYLGITFRSRTAIVIDTGPQISQWRSLAKDAILPGLEKVGNDTQLQIVFAAEKGGAAAYPETPRALTGPAEKDALKKFIDTIEPVGNASPAPAIRKALEGNPQQVIYVTGKSLGNDEINAIASEFNGKGGVRFDTVMIDTEATELAAVVKRQNGRYITPTRQVLVKWFGEIEPKPGE